ncbi:MAG TPA: flagellar basal body P-ring formation protein FlgA [Firmicutes bacterium]|nr:flagellar basal body P-ring formation protein FlgA [Bacillota bacterium]
MPVDLAFETMCRRYRCIGAVAVVARVIAVSLVTAVSLGVLWTWTHAAMAEEGVAPIVVTVKEEAQVAGAKILLGDIATISGAPAPVEDEIKRIEIGPAPIVGYKRTVSLASVKIHMRQAGVDLSRVTFEGAGSTSVTARAMAITGEELVRVAVEYILSTMPWKRNEVSIECERTPDNLLTPLGEVRLEAERLPITQYLGTTTVRVNVILDGKVYKSVPVVLRLNVVKEVVVATRTIIKGQVVTADAVTRELRQLSALEMDPATDPAAVVGKVAARTIREGTLITAGAVEEPPLIKRGDIIQIVVRLGGVTVTTAGEALEDGKLKDLIRVKNLESGRQVEAVVVDAKIAEVSPPLR